MSSTARTAGAPTTPAVVPARRRRPRGSRYTWSSLLYVAPALAFFAVFVIVPIVQSVRISFYSWDGITVATPVGFANYTAVFTDPTLREALGHSLVLLIFYAALPVIIGLMLAGLMSRIRIYGLTLFRALLFLPQILSSVVVAVAWRDILADDGALNQALRAVGLGSVTRSWLGDFTTALPAIGGIGTWVEYGLCMVLFLAGIATIDRSVYEASRLDGAGPIREFVSITLPALRPQISIALILTITFALRNFDLIWNTTRGGPGTSTAVPSVYIYQDAFQNRLLGQASALAVVLTLLTLLIVAVVQLALREAPDRPAKARKVRSSAPAEERSVA